MVVPPRSQRCLKHSEHKQRSSGARRPMQRIDPRSVSPGIKPQRQTWLASSRAESGRADYPMCENTHEARMRRIVFSIPLLPVALASVIDFQIDEVEKDFLRA